MFGKILVALDGSPASEKALTVAIDLATHYRTEITALGVAESPEIVGMVEEVDAALQNAEEHFRRIFAASVEYAQSKGVALRSILIRGHAADAIVRYAESEKMDLVVVGHHGHSRIARFFLGSTSERVGEHSPCTVMIVK